MGQFKVGDRVRTLVPRDYISAGMEMVITQNIRNGIESWDYVCDAPGRTNYIPTKYRESELSLVLPPKREENNMRPIPRSSHVQIKGQRYLIRYNIYDAPFIRFNDRVVLLSTLDDLEVPYQHVTPDPFDNLEAGLYVSTDGRYRNPANHRVYRKLEDGTWEYADVVVRNFIKGESPEIRARSQFEKGTLTRIYPAGV